MVRLISRQRGRLAALKLTKLFGIDDFPVAKDSGKVLIIIIYCYLIIIIIIFIIIICLLLNYSLQLTVETRLLTPLLHVIRMLITIPSILIKLTLSSQQVFTIS